MNPAEYWVLASVVVERWSVSVLDPMNEDTENLFHRGHHGLTKVEVIRLLDYLHQKGDLTFSSNNVIFEPTISELSLALAGDFCLSYELTPQGGARWEAIAKPDWSRHLLASSGEVVAGGREIIEQYLSFYEYIWSTKIIEGSLIWNMLTPWQATYWRILPDGYSVSFQVTRSDSFPPPWIPSKWLDTHRLYTNYLEEL